MDTRKHLIILCNLTSIFSVLTLVGTIVGFIAMISGEGSLLFLVCAILSVGLYLSFVITKVIIDFYDAIVIKHQMETAILNVAAEDDKNSQK